MSKYKILIIEDDDDIRTSIKMLLQSENFEIIEANNGNIGIEKFNDSINLIILDIMMPGISGLEVCEIIRRESIVPILFLTAKASESDKLDQQPYSLQKLHYHICLSLKKTGRYTHVLVHQLHLHQNG